MPPDFNVLVIYSEQQAKGDPDQGMAGFWSSDDGWTTFAGATRFSKEESEVLSLPYAGDEEPSWVSVDDVPAILARLGGSV